MLRFTLSQFLLFGNLIQRFLSTQAKRCLSMLSGFAQQSRATGQGLVEYALILVLIAIAVIAILTQVGTQTSTVFARISCTMTGGELHTDSGNNNSLKCKNN